MLKTEFFRAKKLKKFTMGGTNSQFTERLPTFFSTTQFFHKSNCKRNQLTVEQVYQVSYSGWGMKKKYNVLEFQTGE